MALKITVSDDFAVIFYWLSGIVNRIRYHESGNGLKNYC